MKNKKNRHIVLFILGLLCVSLAQAQESVNASGSNALGSGGTVSYSIGQIACSTQNGSSGSVAQGVQHAFDIFSIGIKNTVFNISLTAFPNPTTENLCLQVNNFAGKNLLYQLYDMQGKLLDQGQLNTTQTQINTACLLPSTYFVYVVNQEKQKIQSFKIIKN